ncbi:M48 family metallopeptidase [Brachyspira innocens]|uniref:M48 family metallopeptidase n=1 Tax=Brachyspira innocens TaxID=13264 RepID=UPI0026F2845D|nr:SprT family zinc-dependent metalloprotease [Brachyspira innocens]
MNEIIIEYKKIKNIYIRVKSDLNIYVTAPKRVSKKYIYELVANRKDWIEERKENIKKKNSYDIGKKELINGDKIYYLGKCYELNILKSKKENIIINDKIINMYANIKEDEKFIDVNIKRKYKLLETWYKEEALKLFDTLLKKYCLIMALEIKGFTVKKLKSKWGSCDTLKKHITLNLELMKYPVIVSEYIVIHELAHLIEANHSKKFYEIIKKYMPEYKKVKKILNSFFNDL